MRTTRLMFLSAGTALLLGLGVPASAGTHGKMMGGGTMDSMVSGDKKAAAKVTDPVCGMEVDPKTAPSAKYKGKTYYFCGPEDKAKFVKDPETYLKKKPA